MYKCRTLGSPCGPRRENKDSPRFCDRQSDIKSNIYCRRPVLIQQIEIKIKGRIFRYRTRPVGHAGKKTIQVFFLIRLSVVALLLLHQLHRDRITVIDLSTISENKKYKDRTLSCLYFFGSPSWTRPVGHGGKTRIHLVSSIRLSRPTYKYK